MTRVSDKVNGSSFYGSKKKTRRLWRYKMNPQLMGAVGEAESS